MTHPRALTSCSTRHRRTWKGSRTWPRGWGSWNTVLKNPTGSLNLVVNCPMYETHCAYALQSAWDNGERWLRPPPGMVHRHVLRRGLRIATLPYCPCVWPAKNIVLGTFFCHNCPSCTNKRDWSVCVDCRVWSSFLRHLSDLNDASFCLHRVFKLNSELLEFSWATFCMPPKLPLCSKSWEYHS